MRLAKCQWHLFNNSQSRVQTHYPEACCAGNLMPCLFATGYLILSQRIGRYPKPLASDALNIIDIPGLIL